MAKVTQILKKICIMKIFFIIIFNLYKPLIIHVQM